MKNIHEEKKHQCHVCSGFYVSAGRLRKHMLSHTKNVTCDKCGKGFAEEKFLLLHTYKIHVEDKVGEYFIYAIFNWISPFMTLIYAAFRIKIRTLGDKN